jgi:hypothetical protein
MDFGTSKAKGIYPTDAVGNNVSRNNSKFLPFSENVKRRDQLED